MAATVIEKYTWNVNITKGGSPVSGVSVVGFNAADAKIIDATTNASGQLASDLDVEAASHSVTGSTTTTTDRNPYDIRFLNYGDRFVQFGKSFAQRSIDSGFLETDTVIAETNKTTVNGYTGITFNHGSDNIDLTGGTWDEERLYDRSQAEAVDNPQADFLSSIQSIDGVNFTQNYSVDITNITFDSDFSTYSFNWSIGAGSAELTNTTLTRSGGAGLDINSGAVTTFTDVDAPNIADFFRYNVIGTYILDSCIVFQLRNNVDAVEVDNYPIFFNTSSVQLGAAYDTRAGQTFTATAGTLTRLLIETSKTGSPPGNMVAKLYATSGGVPTGAPLATSQPIPAADAGIGSTSQNFEFFDEFTLVASTVYWIGVVYEEGNAPNFIRVYYDGTGPTHPGTAYTFNGAWNPKSWDHGFAVYTGGLITVNLLNGSTVDNISNTGSPPGVTQLLNSVTWTTTGVTEGTSVKVIANESAGTVAKGDVLDETFADSNGEASFTLNYEDEFEPSGLDIIVRARNQGMAVAALADDGGSFTVETRNANSPDTDDMTLLPSNPSANDAYYFGAAETFGKLKIDVSTVVSSGTLLAWEYWNGSSWQAVSNGLITLPDGTTKGILAAYIDLGEAIYSWDIPGDWAKNSVNSIGPLYYFRIRVVTPAGLYVSTPLGRFVQLDTTRYLPFVQNNVITSSGGSTIASWIEDTIAKPFG